MLCVLPNYLEILFTVVHDARRLVVPVKRKRLKVVSTDKRICENVSFSFVCYFEKRTNHINFVSETAAEI